MAGLRAKEADLNQGYLWHWLDNATPKLKEKARGATFLQVSKKDIGSLQIPLPPLAEQQRIVELDAAAKAERATLTRLIEIRTAEMAAIAKRLLAASSIRHEQRAS